MSLRVRLALTFALVAVRHRHAVAIVTPVVVDRGFGAGRGADRRSP